MKAKMTAMTSTLGLAPLLRSLRRGLRESQVDQDIQYIAQSGLFDENFYYATYPDVAAAGIDAIAHYVKHGAHEGRFPCQWFDTSFYRSANPDVVASKINPFRHFCEFGKGEGRVALPVSRMRAGGAGQMGEEASPSVRAVSLNASKVLAESGLFDIDFYRSQVADLSATHDNPIRHYLELGTVKGLNPNEDFDTGFYLSEYPDVARSGMNPLLHFCLHGAAELRNPSPRFDMSSYWLEHLAGTEAQEMNPLVHYRTNGRDPQLRVHAALPLTGRDNRRIREKCENLLEFGVPSELVAGRIGVILERISSWGLAEQAFRQMVRLNGRSANNHRRLAVALEKQGKWWQAAESMSVATELEPRYPAWFHQLGELRERMNRYEAAAEAFKRAVDMCPDSAEYHYRLGYVLEMNGDTEEATVHYELVETLDRTHEAQRFGIGVFHQARGYWAEAARSFAARVDAVPLDAELRYRLGFAYDRCYEWEQAQGCYATAIALNPHVAYWHYRLGYVRERLQEWDGASGAYQAAIATTTKKSTYWRYRLGYVLAKAGRYGDACEAFMAMPDAMESPSLGHEVYRRGTCVPDMIRKLIQTDTTDWNTHLLLGMQYERMDAWGPAASAYSSAVDRKQDHDPSLYRRLGTALYRAGRPREACSAFEAMVVLRRPSGVDDRRYTRTPYQKNVVAYNEYRDCLPIRQGTVLYESYGGASVSDNPRAIFDQILGLPQFSGFLHVWIIKERDSIPDQYRSLHNVIFIRPECDLYLRYLATASHLVNNATFPPWFVRRAGQKYLNTWHGTPLKTLLKDIKGDFMGRKNTVRNFLQCTHLISPNQHTSDILLRSGDIASTFSGKIAETGYPRNDRMINASAESRRLLKAALDLDDERPVVLYAPTWRGTFGDGLVEIDRIVEDVSALSNPAVQILFRGHYSIAERLGQTDLPVKVTPQSIEASDLLAITDVLVTDYSSILFDYLPTRKPIIYYAYDLEEFQRERGLYFDIESLPGILCTLRHELPQALEKSLQSNREELHLYEEARQRFCPHEDGSASRRAVDFFLNDDEHSVVHRYRDDRSALLIYAGAFPPQGITASAINLLNVIDPKEDSVTLVIDPDAVEISRERMARFSRIPDTVKVIGRLGVMVLSPEERWIRDEMNRRYGLGNERMWRIYLNGYQREFERIFGDVSFDSIVDFDGYSIYWTSLFAAARIGGGRKVMYMHSDMSAEYELRFPNLSGIFSVMKEFDTLVSVAPEAEGRNRNAISAAYGVDAGKFACCPNTIDSDGVIASSRAPLDDDLAQFIGDRKTFVAIGRLSPEKDQAKLIRAFAIVAADHYDCCLVLLGDGPLREELQSLVTQLGLDDEVYFAGNRGNPFPALMRSDCLVMSSNHEGQPMVLLEAMTLQKPVVAADIPGTRGILGPSGYGLLVENSVHGLAGGLVEVIRGSSIELEFNAAEYERRAVKRFHEVVLGRAE